MTAQIKGFVTRAESGLVPPESISKNIAPKGGGVAIHYGGGPQAAAVPSSDHQKCIDTWRSWQRYHMSKDWVDIAYTGGFCNHGYAFAGRGAGIRTGANGTNESNYLYYAVVWIGGEGQDPTQEAYDAADWWVSKLRAAGAGRAVKPHRFFKATGCPGSPLANYAATRDGRSIKEGSTPAVPVSPPATPSVVKEIQAHVEVNNDGKWGPETDARAMFMRSAARDKSGWPQNIPFGPLNEKQWILLTQRVIDTVDDGIWGPNSQAAMIRWIKRMQEIIGVAQDGQWGPRTDSRFLTLRRRYRGNY